MDIHHRVGLDQGSRSRGHKEQGKGWGRTKEPTTERAEGRESRGEGQREQRTEGQKAEELRTGAEGRGSKGSGGESGRGGRGQKGRGSSGQEPRAEGAKGRGSGTEGAGGEIAPASVGRSRTRSSREEGERGSRRETAPHSQKICGQSGRRNFQRHPPSKARLFPRPSGRRRRFQARRHRTPSRPGLVFPGTIRHSSRLGSTPSAMPLPNVHPVCVCLLRYMEHLPPRSPTHPSQPSLSPLLLTQPSPPLLPTPLFSPSASDALCGAGTSKGKKGARASLMAAHVHMPQTEKACGGAV